MVFQCPLLAFARLHNSAMRSLHEEGLTHTYHAPPLKTSLGGTHTQDLPPFQQDVPHFQLGHSPNQSRPSRGTIQNTNDCKLLQRSVTLFASFLQSGPVSFLGCLAFFAEKGLSHCQTSSWRRRDLLTLLF